MSPNGFDAHRFADLQDAIPVCHTVKYWVNVLLPFVKIHSDINVCLAISTLFKSLCTALFIS